ncbi:MAG: 2-phosphosulfolactate phosphatase [Bacteroidota bacterium]
MKDASPNTIEVCFTQTSFSYIKTQQPFVVVVVDILRATSAMCSAFANGLKTIIPVATLEEARSLKEQGYLVAAEREGSILSFADYGNSPLEYQKADIKGKTLVYCTTNGTQAVKLAEKASGLVLGAYVNLDVLTDWLTQNQQNVVILCSGWKNQFSLEDAVFAGALTENLSSKGKFTYNSDSAEASLDLWKIARQDLLFYHEKASHRHRLKRIGQDASIPFCFCLNACKVVPGLREGVLVDFLSEE